MNSELILYLGRRTLETAMLVAGPTLIVALVVGFLSALIQAITSIRDMTLGMVMKIAAVGITVLLTGGWMMQVATSFTMELFNTIRTVGTQ